jgi:hypothetical protein
MVQKGESFKKQGEEKKMKQRVYFERRIRRT